MPKLPRTYLKKKIFASDQGEAKHQPAGILVYFEDLMRGFNADMGQKGFFEIGSGASLFRMHQYQDAGAEKNKIGGPGRQQGRQHLAAAQRHAETVKNPVQKGNPQPVNDTDRKPFP